MEFLKYMHEKKKLVMTNLIIISFQSCFVFEAAWGIHIVRIETGSR